MKQRVLNVLFALALFLPCCCQLVYRKCAFGVEECVWNDCPTNDPIDLSTVRNFERRSIELYYDSLHCQFVRDEGTYNCCPKTTFEQGDINLQPVDQICGQRRTSDAPRIATPGLDSLSDPKGHWPWMASYGKFVVRDDAKDEKGNVISRHPFRIDPLGTWRHWCGATIISRKHAVTAAHCYKGEKGFLRVGDLDLTSPRDDDDMTTYPVKDVHVHPKFVDPRFYYDVAVLEMRGNGIVFSNYALPICLPPRNSNPDTNSWNLVSLTGWGKESKNDVRSNYPLKRAIISIFPKRYCNLQHTFEEPVSRRLKNAIRKNLPELFQDNVICAGYEGVDLGSCEGDSGGPLVRLTYDSRDHAPHYEQVGIVSGGIGRCGDANIPGVYVRMADPEVNAFIRRISGLEVEIPTTSSPPTTTPTTQKPPAEDHLSLRSDFSPLSAISLDGRGVRASIGLISSSREDKYYALNVYDVRRTTKLVSNRKLSQDLSVIISIGVSEPYLAIVSAEEDGIGLSLKARIMNYGDAPPHTLINWPLYEHGVYDGTAHIINFGKTVGREKDVSFQEYRLLILVENTIISHIVNPLHVYQNQTDSYRLDSDEDPIKDGPSESSSSPVPNTLLKTINKNNIHYLQEGLDNFLVVSLPNKNIVKVMYVEGGKIQDFFELSVEDLRKSQTGAITLTSKYMFVAVGRGKVAQYVLEEDADRTKKVGQYIVAPHAESSTPREPVDVVQVAVVGRFLVAKLRGSGEYPYPVLVAIDTNNPEELERPQGYILEEPVNEGTKCFGFLYIGDSVGGREERLDNAEVTVRQCVSECRNKGADGFTINNEFTDDISFGDYKKLVQNYTGPCWCEFKNTYIQPNHQYRTARLNACRNIQYEVTDMLGNEEKVAIDTNNPEELERPQGYILEEPVNEGTKCFGFLYIGDSVGGREERLDNAEVTVGQCVSECRNKGADGFTINEFPDDILIGDYKKLVQNYTGPCWCEFKNTYIQPNHQYRTARLNACRNIQYEVTDMLGNEEKVGIDTNNPEELERPQGYILEEPVNEGTKCFGFLYIGDSVGGREERLDNAEVTVGQCVSECRNKGADGFTINNEFPDDISFGDYKKLVQNYTGPCWCEFKNMYIQPNHQYRTARLNACRNIQYEVTDMFGNEERINYYYRTKEDNPWMLVSLTESDIKRKFIKKDLPLAF